MDKEIVETATNLAYTAIGAAVLKDQINKWLGPTSDYIGNNLQGFAKNRLENLSNILSIGERKLGNKINKYGEVPPKILKIILNDASYCNDSIGADYFGGILASSRTELGRDDRGARIARMLDSMSTYQIRMHYVIYTYIRKAYHQSDLQFTFKDCQKMRITIPWNVYASAMKFHESETRYAKAMASHIFYGLNETGLIDSFSYKLKESTEDGWFDREQRGIHITASVLGAELYLWGLGDGGKDLSYIFENSGIVEIPDIPISLEDIKFRKL